MRWFSRPPVSVIFVCTANVCRSPMAEGMLRQALREQNLNREVGVASAGTHAGQSGRRADPRALQVCNEVGVDLRGARARQFRPKDYARFDHILAMDKANIDWLLNNSPTHLQHRISLLRSWPEALEELEVPDPYYGNIDGFRNVLELLQRPLEQLAESLARQVRPQ